MKTLNEVLSTDPSGGVEWMWQGDTNWPDRYAECVVREQAAQGLQQ